MPFKSNQALETASYVIKEIIQDYTPQAKAGLHFVNKLKEIKQESNTVEFVKRLEDSGLLSITARGQNSPLIKQGTYQKYSAAALEIKAMKMFNEEDLNNLLSLDKTNRGMAREHIRIEQEDLLTKGMNTQEVMAWQAFAKGEIAYSQYDQMAGIHLNPTKISYPIQARTLSDTLWWGEATQTSVVPRTDIDNAIDRFKAVAGNPPTEMWMTNDTLKTLRNATQISDAIKNWYRSQNIGDVTPSDEQVSKAFNWPAIRTYDKSFLVELITDAAATAGSEVTINIRPSITNSAFGLDVGNIVFIGGSFLNGTYTESDVITAITPGVSIRIRTLDANLAAGSSIWIRPTFMPNDSIVLVDNTVENMAWGLAPFGIGEDAMPLRWYGWQTTPFMMNEPNIATYYRVWNSLIPLMFSPKRIMKFKVRDLAEEYAAGKIGV